MAEVFNWARRSRRKFFPSVCLTCLIRPGRFENRPLIRSINGKRSKSHRKSLFSSGLVCRMCAGSRPHCLQDHEANKGHARTSSSQGRQVRQCRLLLYLCVLDALTPIGALPRTNIFAMAFNAKRTGVFGMFSSLSAWSTTCFTSWEQFGRPGDATNLAGIFWDWKR